MSRFTIQEVTVVKHLITGGETFERATIGRNGAVVTLSKNVLQNGVFTITTSEQAAELVEVLSIIQRTLRDHETAALNERPIDAVLAAIGKE